MKFFKQTLVMVGVLTFTVVLAQSLGLATSSTESLGSFLTDADGNSVYATLQDAPDAPGCDDACAAYWPTVTSEGLATAGGDINSDLIDEVVRADGTVQVTYAGWPLYYFQHDLAAGSTRGQANAGIWFLVSPEGELVGYAPSEPEESSEEPAVEVVATDEFAGIMALGEEVYARICSACHGPGGEGGAGVRLISNSRLADAHAIADAVTHGLAYMPPLGGSMTAEETAAVLTYVRNSWDNSFGEVPLEVVEEVRGE